VPPTLHWDTWLGAVPPRPYSPDYLPAIWRRWWAFGEGTLGDLGCHFMDLPTWALKLASPSKVRAQGPPPHPHWCPAWLEVTYEFAARGAMPPVKLTWYDAGRKPPILKELNLKHWMDGVLFIGDKGQLISNYDRHELLPADQFKDFRPPPATIPASVGHHKEWVLACLNEQPSAASCGFSYSGPLTETALLGMVSHRAGNRELQWDPTSMRATNAPEATEFIRLGYRPGWTL
jgi:hypothetical protein